MEVISAATLVTTPTAATDARVPTASDCQTTRRRAMILTSVPTMTKFVEVWNVATHTAVTSVSVKTARRLMNMANVSSQIYATTTTAAALSGLPS